MRNQVQKRVRMSQNLRAIRLKVSASLAFLLFFQLTFSQNRFEKVNEWVTQNLPELGGRAVLMVYKDGALQYSQAFNNLSKRQQAAGKIRARVQGKDEDEILQDYTPTTRERIASASKWLSAALVLTFVDEGKLRLSDTVGKYLPALSRYGKGHIRIWHCLSHTTGLKEPALRETLGSFQKIKSMDQYIESILTYPMEGEPGKVFRYGNTGLQIAAAVLEKISGKDFETLFAERIAAPLEMKNTDFGKSGLPLAAGGAWSTPEDYMNFLVMLLNEGAFNGKRILSKALVHEMMKNKLGSDCLRAWAPEEAGTWGYGFGAWVMDPPLAIATRKDAMPDSKRGDAVTSPGLFGSFPWVENEKKYAAFLFVHNLQHKGRNQLYATLKRVVDNAVE